MANPFPFVAGDVLTAAELNGIGESATYTPTYTNFSLGNGTVTARYVQVQKLVSVFISIGCGSTSAFTGTQMQISKPITSNTIQGIHGQVQFFDASLGALFFGPVRYGSSTTETLDLYLVNGTYASAGFTNASTPFTIAAGDVIFINFSYEAA